MKINYYEEYKKVGDIKIGECFCFSSLGEFYMKTNKGFSVCLNDGEIIQFNDDVLVSPVEFKPMAVRKNVLYGRG